MTVKERISLYEKLYKNCKAVEPVAQMGYRDKTPLGKLDLLRELVTVLVDKNHYYGAICPTVTAWVRRSNYVASTREIYIGEPDMRDFLIGFREHLQNEARDPEKEELLYEGNEGITKRVLFRETTSTLYGYDDSIAWAEMVLKRAGWY